MSEYQRRRSTQDASSIDGSMGEPSPRTFQVATEKGGKRLMSEDEVSSLVHSALLRARQATSSFSPRARSARSPLSQSSPGSSSGQSPSYGSGRRPPFSNSPRKTSSALNVPRDEEINGRPSLSTRSRRTTYATPRSRAADESVFSFDGFHTPDHHHTEMENVEVDINGLSIPSNETDELTEYEGELGPSISSVNSSEAIIRRVEEEIANARKAAQEANRRLAGVSANLKDARSGSAEEASHRKREDAAAPKKAAGESRNPSPSVNGIGSNEEEDALFDSAMNIIGEEFDVVEENELFDMPAMKRDAEKAKNEAGMSSDDEAGSEAPSSAIGLNPLEEMPDDERHLPSKESSAPSRAVDVHQQVVNDAEVPMSPSEEIDSLLRDNSNEGQEYNMDETENSGVRLCRSLDVESEDVTQAPSEEVKTPATTKTGNKSKERKVDETQYLATQSIDDASVGENDIRGSKDSLFEEAGDDDNLLEWLPIGASTDQHDDPKEADHKDDKQAETGAPEEDKPMEELNQCNDDAPGDETERSEKESVTPAAAEEDSSRNTKEGKSGEPEDAAAEVKQESGVEARADESDTSDEQEPTEEQGSRPEDQTEDEIMKEMPTGIIYSDVDSLPDATSPSNKEEEIGVEEEAKEESHDEEEHDHDDSEKNDNTDVFIYQVVSAASGEAIAGALSDDGTNADTAAAQKEGEEVVVDEAIEVATEPIQVEDPEEEVHRMNESDSDSHQESKSAEQSEDESTYESNVRESEDPSTQGKSRENVSDTSEVSVEDGEKHKDVADKAMDSEEVVESDDQNIVEDTAVNEDDDDQVTQIMKNAGTTTLSHKDNSTEPLQAEKTVKETKSVVSDDKTAEDDTAEIKENVPETPTTTRSPITSSRSPIQVQPSPDALPQHSEQSSKQGVEQAAEQPAEAKEQAAAAAPAIVPSPRRKALVENRRAEQSRVDEARNAMCGETSLPVRLPNPAKDIVHRAKKVKFKQRYPVPPPMQRPLQASEIVFRNQTPAPKKKLNHSKPKKDLKELLEAAIGDSIQRRSNAFGALKVLSTQKKNKMTLVRTKGFLDATVFAINDDIATHDDFETAVASRTRAVNVILNVASVKEDRYHVFTHPGLADSLVKCMMEDKSDARALACSVLATLAKSAPCRDPLSSTNKLLDTLAITLKGSEPSAFNSTRQPHIQEEKKDYSGDDEASQTVFSGSYSSGSSDHSSAGSENAEARNRARLSACAALLHLSKECSVAQKMCASSTVLLCLVATCNETDNPLHTKCLEILGNLTRFPQNNAIMTRYPGLVDTLIMNGNHKLDVDRLWSMRTLQNLSSDPSSKTILATGTVLELLSVNIMRQKYDEQYAATAALYNISTEPGAVVPLTNTKNVVATLVHVAHNPTSPSDVRLMACDTLATLGLWLQTLAGAGTVPAEVDPVPLPTYVTSGWKRWEK